MLRAVTSKLGGIAVAACALLGLIVLPLIANLFLDGRQSRAEKEHGIIFWGVFVINFLFLIVVIFRINLNGVCFIGICFFLVIFDSFLITNLEKTSLYVDT